LSSSVDDKLKFAVQCPTTQIETQYDHPLLFEDRIAYLDPTETLILFPPKLRLDTGDPAIVNESHLEWDAAWHGGSMATNAIGYASIDLAGGDYDNMVRCWIVARTWEGAEEWRHELPIVKSFSNLASSTDGRTFMLYRTSDGDHDTATELRCRIITTATGALLRDYDLGDYPYYPIESVNKGQGSRVLSETLAIHGDRVIMLAGGNAYDLAPA
jgi:hypothetical protein